MSGRLFRMDESGHGRCGDGVCDRRFSFGDYPCFDPYTSSAIFVFAKAQGMRVVMTRFSFFSFWEENGKMRFSFVSPFASDQTPDQFLSAAEI